MRTFLNFFLHIGGTLKHKFWVFIYMYGIILKLFKRALIHDFSKFSPSEFKGFIQVIHKLRSMTYGSDEYKESLKKIKPSINLHYQRNSHHPEHHKNKLYDMDLVDMIEMLADWKAAIRRHKDGNIERSFEQNRERFQIKGQTEAIMRNSV